MKAEEFRRQLLRFLQSIGISSHEEIGGNHPIIVVNGKNPHRIPMPVGHGTKTLGPEFIKRILDELGISIKDFLLSG